MAGPTTTDHRPHNNINNNSRKSRWDSSAADPIPKPNPPNPNPNPNHNHNHNHNQSNNSKPKASPVSPIASTSTSTSGPPQPTYGFHMLERRTIALSDGSLRTYHALPPDYHHFPSPPIPHQRLTFHPPPPLQPPILNPHSNPNPPVDYWNSLGIADNGAANTGKRKLGGGEEARGPKKPAVRQSEAVAVALTASTRHSEVAVKDLKEAFLRMVKAVNENVTLWRGFLENRTSSVDNGKHGRLHCLACHDPERSSKDFPDTHKLIMHCYNRKKTELLVDHLGLHKALCTLMGWNYSMPPDNKKAYQLLSEDEAAANQDDLILWPPMVIIHNTLTGKSKDGTRMEGLGNKYMDARIKDLGFSGGKSKALYGREGHLGITLIKFSGDQTGLNEAKRLSDHFERENHGRRAWHNLQPLTIGGPEDENNPKLWNSEERSRDKKRILYGYLITSRDIDKVDFDTRKKVTYESLREYKPSK